MARPSDWDVIGLDGDPTPGVPESVLGLAKQLHDFADDVERAWNALNSFGRDTTALSWVGQSAQAFEGAYGPLPGRLQKLYTSYREAGDALDVYRPKLEAAQKKADTALADGRGAHDDVQRLTGLATTAASDLKTAQTGVDPTKVTAAQTAHDIAQKNVTDAQTRLTAATTAANQARDDRIAAAKECQKALHNAQSDGIHNKHWWEHLGADLAKIGGEISEIAGELAPILDIIALATSWIPGLDVITAGLAEAANIIALIGTAMEIVGDGLQGHWGDALMGAGMLGAQFVGGKLIQKAGGKLMDKYGGKLLGKLRGEGNAGATCATDPVDVVSGQMLADENDLYLPGVLPLLLRRAYASGNDTGRLFGPGWSSTLDQRLSVNEAGIHFVGDDAQTLHYPLPEAGQTVLPRDGVRWPLLWDRERDEIRIEDPVYGRTRHFAVAHFSDEHGHIRDLTAISDRNGNRIEFLRDENGTPTGVEHSGGYRVAVETTATQHGPRVNVLRLLGGSNDGQGMTVREFQYDEHGRLDGVANSSGLPYRYEHDAEDRITAWTDRLGYRYAYEYDDAGRVLRTGGDGGYMAATFVYDEANLATAMTDSLGFTTAYRYDENGHVVAVTDPLGNTVRTEYDEFGRLLSRIDPLGGRTVFERDEHGDAFRVTAPDGRVTELGYNRFHQVVDARMPDGALWHRDYDERGNLVAVAEPTGATTRCSYTEHGAAAAGVDPMGSAVRFESDPAGLQTAIIDPLGATTRARRDAFGRVVSVIDPLGAESRFGWTVEGLMAWRKDPGGDRTEWTYDAEGQLLRTVGPNGVVTVIEPGPFGRMAARTGPDGVRHEFAHDTELKLLEVATSAGATWSYSYDAVGRLRSETDFIGRSLAYEHDAAGRTTSRTNGLGDRISFVHDAAGRVTGRHTPEGDFAYVYDSAGELAAAVGPGTTVEYVRDAAGRVLSETTDGRTVAYEYDLAGRIAQRTTASGAVSHWSYDVAGQPTSLRTGTGRLAFGYDMAGREIERLLGADTWLTREMDSTGRLSSLQVWTGDRVPPADGVTAPSQNSQRVLGKEWVWRADGVPVEIHDSLRGTRQFTADAMGRVTGVTASGWRESYAYDAFGNLAADGADAVDEAGAIRGVDRVSADVPAVTPASAPRVIDRTLVRAAGRTSYEHDAAGRLVRTVRRTLDGRRKVWQYAWDSEDRLIRAATPDGVTWRYVYDALGRRIGKVRVDPDGTAAYQDVFLWEGPRLVEQHTYCADGEVRTLTWDYDPGSMRPAAQTRRTWAKGADQRVIDEAFHAIVTDLIGTPTELVAEDGRIAWQTTTNLWGRTVARTADPNVDCPLRFPGQYHDAETGLHYNLHRYYDPDTASYLTPDPLGLEAAPNDHAYVGNPLTMADPYGLMCDTALMKWADESHGLAQEYHQLSGDAWNIKNETTSVVKARFPTGDPKNPWVVKNVVSHSGEGLTDAQVAMAVKRGDIPVVNNLDGFTHAEYNGLRTIDSLGGVPVAGGASRSVCNTVCGPLIRGTGGRISGQVYPLERGTKQRTFYWPGSMTY